MGRAELEEGRLVFVVDGKGVLVPWSKGIALGRVDEIGRRAWYGLELFLGIDVGDGGKESPCIGMLRLEEDLEGGSDLDDLAGIHDGDPVGHVGDDSQIVRDEDDGHVAFLLETVDELENLGLDGDVKGGRRLVADEDLRICRQGNSDDDSLPHAAGELEGVLLEADLWLGDADFAHDLEGHFLGLFLGHLGLGDEFLMDGVLLGKEFLLLFRIVFLLKFGIDFGKLLPCFRLEVGKVNPIFLPGFLLSLGKGLP